MILHGLRARAANDGLVDANPDVTETAPLERIPPHPAPDHCPPVVVVIAHRLSDAEQVRNKLSAHHTDAFQVIIADSLTAAQQSIDQADTKPDVVILDLPDTLVSLGIDGCRQWADVPIVVLAEPEQDTVTPGLIAFGADDCLSKHAASSDLCRAVHYNLLRYQRATEARLAATVFARAHEGIYITEANGTIIDANEAFTRITGYTRAEVIGQNPRLLSSGSRPPMFYESYWRSLVETGYWRGELWNQRKNGERFAALQSVSAVYNARGRVRHFVAVFSDITDQKKQAQQLEHIVHYDMLTGLPNRALFADRLYQAMIMAKRAYTRLAVVFIDLDGFQTVNETHGYKVGDQMLRVVARNMRATLREGDTLARLGGDEFAAVLSDLDSDSTIHLVMRRLLSAISQPCVIENETLNISASIGLTYYPQEDEVAADQLLRQADQAMYQAKQTGKSSFHRFDAELDRDTRHQHQTIAQVREGLLGDQFVLHYQPKVNLRTTQVVGVEALIRWQHPQKGLLPPGAFLPDIENHPLAIDLGHWVIDSALAQMSIWRRHGLELSVSVNISAYHLQSIHFVERLTEHFKNYVGIPPEWLELEILETSALEDILRVSETLQACNALGVRFSFDDFGTGYSSMTYLKQLPAKMIKIDQSFVRDMLQDSNDRAIVKAIIGLAGGFDRLVLAEGVETRQIGEALLNHGCELGQGYGIARPMPAAALPDWINGWQADPQWLA